MNKIRNTEDLQNVSSTIHDARCFSDSIQFDGKNNKFQFNCWIRKRQNNSSKLNKFYWVEYLITFFEIENAQIQVEESVEFYECSTMRYNYQKKLLEIVFHYGMSLNLRVNTLQGILNETGKISSEWD